MSLVGYGYDSQTINPVSGEKKKEGSYTEASRRSSLLEPRKKYETPCYCTTEVDLEVFRGVFTDQWLHGRAYGNNEEIFFCSSCGPSTIQDELRNTKHSSAAGNEASSAGGRGNSAAHSNTAASKSTSAKLKKFFTFGLASSSSSTSLSTSPSKPPLRSTLSKQQLDDEELPVTPRSEKELFLCITCGACYCRDHAHDHHYSRRHVATNVDAQAPSKGYPYHSYFIGVPSYISTHKDHRLKETEWGLLLPTVTVKEVQPYVNTLPTSQSLILKTPSSADKKKAKSSSRLFGSSSASASTPTAGQSSPAPPTLISANAVLSRPIPFYSQFEDMCDNTAVRQLTAVHSSNSNNGATNSSGSGNGATGSNTVLSSSYSECAPFTTGATPPRNGQEGDGKDAGGGGSSANAHDGPSGLCPLSPPNFYCSPPENWSLLVWCASCGDRPIRFSGKHCDNAKEIHAHLRRLGQLLALLAYFRRAGVQLQLPQAYLSYMDKKQAEQHERQMKQRQALSSVEAQRVGKASEGMNALPATTSATSTTVDNYYGESLYDRSSTDRIMTEAALAGFSNPSFYCYVNSVFQCVLRCGLFCRPLLRPLVRAESDWNERGPLQLTRHTTLDGKRCVAAVEGAQNGGAPGKLTLSFVRLMDQLLHQTYQDVRNGAVYPFARTVFHQVCRVCPLFEEDTQQDAQEFLISLLNGVADEFDAEKTEEAKKASKRISFEGVMRHEVVCSSCFHRVPRDEMFMALSIPAKESINAGLKSVFESQKLKGSDKYACEYCFKKLSRTEQASHNDLATLHEQERKELAKSGKKKPTGKNAGEPLVKDCVYQEAEVNTIIAQLGGTLAIHILRFQYDPAIQDFSKVTAPVHIPLTLDLTPHVDTGVIRTYSNARSLYTLSQRFPHLSDEVLEARLKECKWDCAAATRAIQETLAETAKVDPLNASTTSTKGPNAAAGGKVETDESVFADRPGSAAPTTASTASVGLRAPRRKKEVKALTQEAFNPFGVNGSRCPSLQRQLVGIVAHRGSLHGGHYIAFVRLLSQPDVWFRCDDEDVDVVDEKTVLDCSSEVYLAFYE